MSEVQTLRKLETSLSFTEALLSSGQGRPGENGLPGISNLTWLVQGQPAIPDHKLNAPVLNYDEVDRSGSKPYMEVESDTVRSDGNLLDWIDERAIDTNSSLEIQVLAQGTNFLFQHLFDLSYDGKEAHPFVKAHIKA